MSGTLDPLIQSPELERIDGFVGSVITPNYNPTTDFYIPEDLALRKAYPLEPALVFKDQSAKITDVVGYDDIINEIGIQGGKINNLDRLFRSKFYSYNPQIDFDKLINYTQYYWLATGPDAIIIDYSIDVDADIIGQAAYTMNNGYALSNGMKLRFESAVTPESYQGNEYYVEGVGSNIRLINVKLLEVNEAVATAYNETFDSDLFDQYSFDSDKKIPVTPEYITINRASRDLNPWSRYNRWFHSEVIHATAEINNQTSVLSLTNRAQRPIVEFKADLQLYNFGTLGITNIDVIDNDTKDAFASVDGTYGYYVDEVLLGHGNRVVFNADPALEGKIYIVEYDFLTTPPTLRLIEESNALADLASVAVNYGTVNAGTSWHYLNSTWIKSQQHTTINQAPLFDLFDKNGHRYSDKEYFPTSFIGSKVFGYDVGTGTADPVLGFPLKYQNSIGVGSYLFKNYFMSDVITVTVDNSSSKLTTGVTYVNRDNNLVNVWDPIEEYQIPIVEVQTITTASNSLTLTSISSATSVIASVNNSIVKSTLSNDGKTVYINSSTTIKVNDVVSFEINSNDIPNTNGYYKAPLGLTNNPLNGPITDMTLSELSDHLSTMVNRMPGFVGVFPGVSNLRDLDAYTKYGTRLIVNANPISFAQTFLGKKEHNVVDALRYAADQYNQFKMNLLRSIINIDVLPTAASMLDNVLAEINYTKDSRSPYYNSDMLGYGLDKTIQEYRITDTVYTAFNLSALSFQSLLVYLNDEQLIHGTDYYFTEVDGGQIVFVTTLTTGDTVSVHYYADTLGSFVPSSPSKLGLYPAYEPAIYTDSSYIGDEVTVIRGHDGSIMIAYGDYRDDIILEFEKRIYNNIKVTYNPAIFDVTATLPGAFRQSKYLLSDATIILTKDFIKWTSAYNIDATINNVFNENDPFTWNYRGASTSSIANIEVGYWRGLYKYFYDTDRPHTHPWEMLGFSSIPAWWIAEYGAAPYLSTNTALWSDLASGTVMDPAGQYILPLYARSNLLDILPVNASGELKNPVDALSITNLNYANQTASWQFGDQGPAETAWRRSSYWPFAANVASALLDPCSYTSTMFDLSRTTLNWLGQVTYTSDDLYLNPNKLLLDGEVQTAGYGVYVVEKGKNKNINYLESLKQDLTYINFNLFHKLGGFASKDKLQIVIDSIDPVSASQGAILPLEDYELILNESNPIKSASISGVIVQKYNGKFILKGYDKTNPYFEILSPIKTFASGTITVGGVSASFTEWTGTVNNGNNGLSAIDITSTTANTTRYYKQGQIVRYNNTYYIVKVGHVAQPTFDTTYFQALPSLPMTGGATAQLSSRFSTPVTQIPYGTSFTTIQEVYDVLVGYGAYLESQGFVFDEFNTDLNEIVDWKFTGKEFLYWTTQNWADGNLITLSPFADYLKYSYIDSIVDNISTGKYEYSLLKADGKSFPIDKFRLSREDGVCTINTIDTFDGIFFATLNSVQKEHGMVFNNTTIFNDTIYDIETGYKQRRIKLSGFRTANWNGDLYSPGFVYDSIDITDWTAFGIYLPGKVVRYNGAYYESNVKITNDATFDFAKWTKLDGKPISNLLPNFDYKINQFEDFYSLDIDNFDATQQQLAQHLVGFAPRTYLNNIFTNSISQYKFYQGFIKEKGTKNSIDKLAKVGKFTRQGEVSFTEDWAFRVGNYGSFSTYKEIEFTLEESTALENPYLVKFSNVPANANPLINYVPADKLLLTPDDYTTDTTFTTVPGSFAENNLVLTHAGYVRADDVTATAYNTNSLLDIANNSLIQEGNTIWMGFLENGDWGIRRYSKQTAKIAGVYVSAPAVDITFSTDVNHNLSVGDIVSVVKFNDQVNGIHVVTAIPRLDQFTVASELSTIINADLLSFGALFKFENARYSSLEDLSYSSELLKLKVGEKLWIDEGVDNKWQVYEKINNYKNSTINYGSVDSVPSQKLGQSICASDDTNIVMVSAPGWYTAHNQSSIGSVWIYTKRRSDGELDKQLEYSLNSNALTYCKPNTSTEFGYSLAHDINKGLYFAGAPAASEVRGSSSTVGTVILSTGTGNVKSFEYEGLVKISTSTAIYAEVTNAVLVNPYATTSETATHARFGHSIYINQPAASELTTLLVGAPGDSVNTGTGHVYAYSISAASTITVHASGINLNSHETLTNGSQFGHKIAGNAAGSVIAISAPYHVISTTATGVVQIFTGTNLTYSQTISSPFGTNDAFGDDVAISADGAYMFVSSVNTKIIGEPFGKVSVYKLNTATGLYNIENPQIISNPLHLNELKFGTAISISKDNNTLAISALGTNSTELVKFDETAKSGETIFDSGITQFTDPVSDSGTVYVYNNLNGYFIEAEELIDSTTTLSELTGNKYGSSVVALNSEILVGAPAPSGVTPDNSRFYRFAKIDSTLNSWKVLRQQVDLVDVSTVDRIALIDSFKEEIVEYLDVIDPLKGKIAGIAEQELKYKSAFDPATYTIGLASTIIDANTSWIDAHVGELWWDLSTTKYMWYEQGDDIFRKNNWGKLFPGSSIDIYEWVRSNLLPSEWAAQADTNEGLTKGISGQPKYPDNSIVSIKQSFNNVTNAFENVYFFWVKNKVTVPASNNRRISGYQVASIIADPVANGLQFAEILSADSVAFANVQPMLVGDKINANIAIDTTNNEIPRHTEWLLLAEGDAKDVPTTLLEKKLFDSLLGHDSLGNPVPAADLTYRNRYGISIRPQQTMFKDRIEALRNLVEFSNSVLIKNRITGNYNFDNLNRQEAVPDTFSREYDLRVENLTALENINPSKYYQAELVCSVYNGKIATVDIVSAGYGYTLPPKVTIVSTTDSIAEILTEINSDGEVIGITISNAGSSFVTAPRLIVRPHTVIVDHNPDFNNIWTTHIFDYNAYNINPTDTTSWWIRIKNQSYNTTKYWNEVDWVSDTYNAFKDYSYVLNQVSELPSLVDIKVGDYVKIYNAITGHEGLRYYIILERLASTELGNFAPSYNIVFSELGTIQISDTIWNYDLSNYSFDAATLDETLYDQIPDLELFYILTALKNDIFIDTLKVNWNLFFFTAVKYALTEQKLLDWAFKTSFINVSNLVGELDQRSVYKLDNEQYFEDYINEVKPYHTNIRTYSSNYSYLENADKLDTTDFDLPAYYNTLTQTFDSIDLSNELINEFPWKSWADNYTSSIGSIMVANPGTRYTELPTVTITGGGPYVTTTATASAYIRSGGIYGIEITNAGAGYTENPVVTITGGGPYVTTNATASATLLNLKTRKNLIGLKFDRVNAQPEIGTIAVNDEFVCPGNADKFVLTWLAEPNKLSIVPTLDGKLILSADYTIEYFSDEYNGYNKKYSRFVFLNYIPAEDQLFKISYNKNINLYTAVDRISNIYTATDTLESLMTGVVYPNATLQGLPFNYSTNWDHISGKNRYDIDNTAWGDLTTYYATAKLISTATIGTSTLYLNTTTDIIVGQTINILNSSTIRVRGDTVVVAVNTASRSITISTPSFAIKTAKSTATSIGTDIIVQTKTDFNGGIDAGDIVSITEVVSSGYNGYYAVKSVIDTDRFIVTATSVLSTSTAILTTSSLATVSTILDTVNSNDIFLHHLIDNYQVTSSTFVVNLDILYDDIAKIKIFNDGAPEEMGSGIPVIGPHPVAEFYQITKGSNNNAVVTFYQMYIQMYELSFFIYGHPTIEFWKPDTMSSVLDSAIPGGSWSSGNFVDGQGVAFTSTSILSTTTGNIIDGDSFLNVRSGYAPEELVAGYVIDSLGINVYTKAEDSYALVLTGAIPIVAGITTEFTIGMPLDDQFGIMLHVNGKIFNRVSTNYFYSSNEYFIRGNQVIIPPQTTSGRAGYTLISTGGNRSVIDSNMKFVVNTSTAVVVSLASVNDIRKAYVLVDGVEINEITTSTDYGYMLTNVGNDNYRACVKVYNLSLESHTVEAWFFESKYTQFNRVHEEVFNVDETPQSIFELASPPGIAEPVSSQVIVELTSSTDPLLRRRLLPAWTSYYQLENDQLTFKIDNTHTHPSGTYHFENVAVYANGAILRPGFDYTLDTVNSTITIAPGLLLTGDAIAVVGMIDQDYIISAGFLELTSAVTSSTVKVISFTDHDNMMIRTERFDGNVNRQFTLLYPVFSDNYIWVYVNGIPLTARYDYEILDNARTIRISDWIAVDDASDILVTTVNPPSYGSQILGFRVFKDIFDRQHFKRLASYYSTTLSQALHYTDDEIHVVDATKLIPPNPLTNKPGIVIIDGERIEYLVKDGNILRQLRRSTLGTGPAEISNTGTSVIDQSLQQTIPTVDSVFAQKHISTNTTTYVISTLASTSTGAGIKLLQDVAAIDQVMVYYGGRQLRKTSLVVHDRTKAYDTTSTSITTLPPEFAVEVFANPDYVAVANQYAIDALQMVAELLPVDLAYDLNGDGEVTLADAIAYEKIAVNLPLGFTPSETSNYYNLMYVQQVTLNIDEMISLGTQIDIVQRKGQIWTGTESLLTSNVIQAQFLRDKEAALPNIYYYGG